MSLIEMSVSGAAMILFTVVIRALLLHKLPKRTFPFLWIVVLVRLLVPYSLPSTFSAYSLLTQANTALNAAENNTAPPISGLLPGNTATPSVPSAPSAPSAPAAAVSSAEPRTLIWLIGGLACLAFFTVSYVKCLRKFRESLPVDDNEYINQWLSGHRLFRKISVRSSDRILSPLTYGIFHPVILLPKKLAHGEPDDLRFVLSHEYVHIRRFDMVFKLALTAALCVHWFNPAVWIMYFIANRDIEISCDEAVVRMFGEREKTGYALALIRMEEEKSGLAPLVPHCNKSAIEERIVTIMKFKKTTAFTIAAAVFLTLGMTAAFATSAPHSDEPAEQTSGVIEPASSAPADDTTSDLDTPVSPVTSSDSSEISDISAEEPSSSTDTSLLPEAPDDLANDPRIPAGKPVTVEERIDKYGEPYKVFYIGWDEDDTEHKGSCATAMYADAMYVYRLEESDAPIEPVEDPEYSHRVDTGEVIIYW